MQRKYKGKDNSLLVEFESIVDLDMAIYRYLKLNYLNNPILDQTIMTLDSDTDVISHLISRKHINPLETLMPNQKPETSKKLYYTFMNDLESELLQLANAYDIFSLMLTFLNEASSVNIDILCKNDIEREYIQKKAPNLNVIVSEKMDINLSNYSALYLKYIYYFMQYQPMMRKYVYVHMAGYNSDELHDTLNIQMVGIIAQDNMVKTIDPYQHIKYFLKGETNKDGSKNIL